MCKRVTGENTYVREQGGRQRRWGEPVNHHAANPSNSEKGKDRSQLPKGILLTSPLLVGGAPTLQERALLSVLAPSSYGLGAAQEVWLQHPWVQSPALHHAVCSRRSEDVPGGQEGLSPVLSQLWQQLCPYAG